MPGLLRGIARTAVVAGTATAVSNRVSRRQANRWAQDDQSAYAQPQYARAAVRPAAVRQPQYAPAPARASRGRRRHVRPAAEARRAPRPRASSPRRSSPRRRPRSSPGSARTMCSRRTGSGPERDVVVELRRGEITAGRRMPRPSTIRRTGGVVDEWNADGAIRRRTRRGEVMATKTATPEQTTGPGAAPTVDAP